MAEIKVNFANTNVFFPGELVNGIVVASITKRLDITAVILTLLGKSSCQWSNTVGNTRTTYKTNERHFSKTITLTGASDSEPILPDPGEFKIPFSFRLPLNIPPRFDFTKGGSFGRTDYTLTVILKRKGIFKSNVKSTHSFWVKVPQKDASQFPRLLEAVTRLNEKFLCCLCCQSGPILIRLQLNKQVFYVGEPIPFHAQVDNSATNKTLGVIKGKLVKRVTLSNKKRRKEFNVTQGSVLLAPSLIPGSQDSWNAQLNLDGVVLDPTFENSRCVTVTYFFVLKVKIPWGINARIEIPVTILPRRVSGILQPIRTQPPVGVEQHQTPGLPPTHAVEPPVVEQPVVEQPVVEPPVVEPPVVEPPVVEPPVVEQPESPKPSFDYSRL